ncbi:MAG TPA: PilZ domain-containing protein [Pseudolabrys sp.]|jgi:hypothetical protein|uniref:PilZ domain-containing protein n=1 Tax=Pseudolabrys sp. TaxID=1960880 RepID=UPI002DDDA6CB|nr:PilZ domain-containing protein [Pseudolabrys sp.]HEV2631397.1 PilZ domain-containing protein [Pseudolabrys sp.]
MVERRTTPRHRTFKGGSISFTGAAAIECVVRNLSAAGACLEVMSPIGIPEDFDLIIRPEYKRHHCHLVWRKAQRLGVRFV